MAGERGWKPIQLPGIPPARGAYSRAIQAGDFLFVSGQVPRDLESGALLGDDVESQTHSVLENVRRILESTGASLDDVVSVTAYLADIGQWDKFDSVYRTVFRPPYPTRTTVGAQLRDVLVEITVIAKVR